MILYSIRLHILYGIYVIIYDNFALPIEGNRVTDIYHCINSMWVDLQKTTIHYRTLRQYNRVELDAVVCNS